MSKPKKLISTFFIKSIATNPSRKVEEEESRRAGGRTGGGERGREGGGGGGGKRSPELTTLNSSSRIAGQAPLSPFMLINRQY
jgi:hypothetical protein